MNPLSSVDKTMQECVDACRKCHQVCLETIFHCLPKDGAHASADHIRLLMDCAHICQVSADFINRGSAFQGYMCGVCAEICEQCAEDCKSIGPDEQMQRCIDRCQQCAQSCQEMSQM